MAASKYHRGKEEQQVSKIPFYASSLLGPRKGRLAFVQHLITVKGFSWEDWAGHALMDWRALGAHIPVEGRNTSRLGRAPERPTSTDPTFPGGPAELGCLV